MADRINGPLAASTPQMTRHTTEIARPLALPSPVTSPEDITELIAKLTDACDAAGETAKGDEMTIKKAQQDRARQEHLDAVKHEAEEEAKKGSGFFGSIGSVIKDTVHDAVTLHVQDIVTDAKDNVVKAANSKQFWQDLEAGAVEVAKWGAVATSAAVAVATCGSATAGTVAVVCAVAGASLSAAAAAESEGHFLQKAGVDEKTDGWLVMGGTLAGAGASAVGGFAAASHMAAAAASQATTSAGSQATTSAATALSRETAKVGAQLQLVNAAVDTGGGAAHMVVAKFDSDLAHTKVETKAAEMRKTMLQRIVQELSQDLKELQQERTDNQKSALDTQRVVGDATHSLMTWRA
jgi:hypothetical protein